MNPIRLGILSSTQGTDMQALIAAIQQKELNAEIKLVISNKADAGILARAQDNQIKAIYVDPRGLSREDYDKKKSELLNQHQIELVVLIGYMRILTTNFIHTWRHKIINVHPSLLPEFAGGMDKNIHQAVLAAGKKETGCTVHWVTEEVDAGPVIIQKRCAVKLDDDVASLKKRVQALEGQALIEAITGIQNHAY